MSQSNIMDNTTREIYNLLDDELKSKMISELSAIKLMYTGDGIVSRMTAVTQYNNKIDKIESKYKKLIKQKQ